MPYPVPTYPDITQAILRDIASQRPTAWIGADSDYRVRANSCAAAVEGLYRHQVWGLHQMFPDTADTDFLEAHATLYGLVRKAAALAGGSVTFAGTVGAAIGIGVETKTATGIAFVTTAAGVIGGAGTVALACAAVIAGEAGNQPAATPLTLTAAPVGILSQAVVVTMTGGTEVEPDAALLERLLSHLREPPAGGNQYDYRRWCLEIAGITRAYVFPLRRGLGTVDVAVFSGAAAPAPGTVTAAQTNVDLKRPVTANSLVLAPTFINVAITATLVLSGTTLGDATTAINGALDAYFATLKPGDTVIRNAIGALIKDTFGVVDYALTLPAANVVTLVDLTHLESGAKGTVTLT